jgi:acyl-CoA synthetase (NDP forming)
MTVLASDGAVSIVIMYLASMPFFEQRTRLLGQAGMASGKPVIVVGLPGTAADRPRAALRDVGCPYFDSVEDMLAALRGFLDYRELAQTVVTPPSRPKSVPPTLPNEVNSLARFAERYGVAFASEQTCATVDDAVAAARDIGFPVVLKGNVEGITHKSDLGLVRTGLHTENELREAWGAIETSAGTHAGAAKFAGCLVQEQIPSGLELICSIRRDPQFGPLILVGAGGVTVELTRDTISTPAPVSPARAEELLRSLRLAPLFDGYRGGARIDVGAAAKIVANLSWLAVDLGERLVDLEINPLIVGRTGAKAVDLRGQLNAIDLRRPLSR